IIDIKPYLPYVDAHPEASNGFALASKDEVLEVVIPDKIAKKIDAKTLEEIRAILSMDPRPQYIEDSDRVFGAEYGCFNIKFRVNGKVLTVIDAQAAGQT
nr:tRNA (N6-threonylcarbamoyladenosine(37)-N6)-methyltransferase TrmO [Clostridia bacterium]